jgi:hypothetical protein
VNGSNQKDTHRTVERVARESYGGLVAYLSVHTHDLASAEDALSKCRRSAIGRRMSATKSAGLAADDGAPLLIDLVGHQQVAAEKRRLEDCWP